MYTLNQTNPFQQYINAINNQWPYLQAKDYKNINSITETFPHLKNINKNNQKNKSNLNNQIQANNQSIKPKKNCLGLIIRSANDDNVHKAIKYGIWTTTPKNKLKLQQLWQKSLKQKTQIYLFFSVVKSGMFEGVARLTSDYYEETFPFWWQNHSLKFKGYFHIEWVYIKDINYKHFDGLFNMQNQEVTKSKDCDLLDIQTTNKMLQTYDKRPLKRYIFDDFQKMDDRQKYYIRKMYEYVLQQQYQQQLMYNNYSNYVFKQPSIASQNSNYNGNSLLTNSYTPPHQSTGTLLNQFNSSTVNPIMPIPPQMMRPNHLDPKNANNLGFQMNPVSKNRKK